MQYIEVHTVQDFIAYCRAILAEHPERMSDKEQQDRAGAIVVLMVNDEYDNEWQKYPQIAEIIEIGVSLDRLDTSTGGWGRIRRLIDELQKLTEDEAGAR